MMYELILTNAYKKGYKRMKKRGMDMSLLDDVVDKLLRGENLDEKYDDHTLEGQLSDCRECHIKPDWVLVYRRNKTTITLTLVDTGTHQDMKGWNY